MNADKLADALRIARNGLQWYQDRYPESTNGCDDEAMAQIDATLAEHDAQPAQAAQPVAQRLSEIEDSVAQNKMSGSAVFTQMRQLIAAQPVGGPDEIVYVLDNVAYGDDWFARLMVEGVMFLVPLENADEARHILAEKKRRPQPPAQPSADAEDAK